MDKPVLIKDIQLNQKPMKLYFYDEPMLSNNSYFIFVRETYGRILAYMSPNVYEDLKRSELVNISLDIIATSKPINDDEFQRLKMVGYTGKIIQEPKLSYIQEEFRKPKPKCRAIEDF